MTNPENGHSWPTGGPATAYAHGGPAALSDPDLRQERSVLRLATAERVISQAYAGSTGNPADMETISIAFAAVRDALAEARELSLRAQDELEMARRERLVAQRDRARESVARTRRRPPEAPADPIMPDSQDARFCPDPQHANDAAELLDTLRRFRVWAGRPSYRAMARQCGNRYAPSTLHGALHSGKLPGLDILLAVVHGCRGSGEHAQAFATAWRRLEMSAQNNGRAEPAPILRQVPPAR